MGLLKFKTPVDLSGYTLVVPSVSVGNVPQLTVDLLIMTMKLEKVATLWHPGVLACVGADPFYSNNTAISTACELYINQELKVATFQLRSTIETKLLLKFLADLVDCIVQLKFQRVFILGTGFDYELHNIENKNTFYFVTSAADCEEISNLTSSKMLKLDDNRKLTVRGSGFATKLYEVINNKVNTTLVIKYIAEGENINDAQDFLIKLFQYLRVKAPNAILFPSSWHHIYGGPPPEGLF